MSTKYHRDYPHLTFRRQWSLTEKAALLLGQCEAYVNAIRNTPILPKHYEQLMNVSLIKGAQATTAIEGNTLTEDEIQQILDHKKLPPSKEYQKIEVENILLAFNTLLQELVYNDQDAYISASLLLRFHQMVGQNLGEHFSAVPGKFRENDVTVGRYRCPDHRDVPILVDELCGWLKQEFHYGSRSQSFSEVLIQAITTHVYIEWIHPFGDGNGRTGRLVEYYLLLRGGNPDITSHLLSNHYNLTRTAYYRELEKAHDQRDLSQFIEYALLGFRDGLVLTLSTIQRSQFRLSWQKMIYDMFEAVRAGSHEKVFQRQRTLALELPFDQEFKAADVLGLSIPLAQQYAGVSEKTVERDLEKLEEMGLAVKRDTRFIANKGVLYGMIARRRG
ncbi:MAG: Fic family protein [Bacteroidetes bacterium]|nr:Fic family protein [Bacteroidota bacterium]